MSDSASRHGAANEHGVYEDRLLDRRRFLARLGAAGAVGAALLAVGETASGMALGLARGAATGGARGAFAPRPIYMMCLGDSVMWGQGLADDQKFQAKVERWIEQTNPDRRQVVRWNFAHSGATLGALSDPEAVSGGTGRMTAAAFAHVARAHPRDPSYDEVPDFVPPTRLAAAWSALADPASASAPPPPPSTSTGTRSTSGGRPHEPTDGDRLGGEIPRSYPSLWRQLDLALELLRTGRDPRNPLTPPTSPVDPADVDLVLLNGGANDVDFLGTVLDVLHDSRQTYDRVRGIVEPRMREYLPRVLEAFPRATVVLTTYYRGLSALSSPGILTPLVAWYVAVPSISSVVLQTQIGAMVGRNDAMERGILDAYRAAAGATQKGGVLIVSPDFAPDNAYGAPRHFVWHFEETDRAEAARRQECGALLGQWTADMTGVTSLSGGSMAERADTSPWAFCIEADTFHPNPAGAQRYFERIRDTLAAAKPEFLRPLPKLRVQVAGTTQGDTKTVTVTAFDLATGQPVDGTVTVGDATGRTGAPITYRATCGVESAAAVEPVTNAKGAVRRAPTRRTTVAPRVCSGTVSASGYANGTFSY